MKFAIVALAAASLVAGPALAQAKPATAMKTSTRTTTTKSGGNTAVHTTTTGKKITYDCSKKGNANKTACKKK